MRAGRAGLGPRSPRNELRSDGLAQDECGRTRRHAGVAHAWRGATTGSQPRWTARPSASRQRDGNPSFSASPQRRWRRHPAAYGHRRVTHQRGAVQQYPWKLGGLHRPAGRDAGPVRESVQVMASGFANQGNSRRKWVDNARTNPGSVGPYGEGPESAHRFGGGRKSLSRLRRLRAAGPECWRRIGRPPGRTLKI